MIETLFAEEARWPVLLGMLLGTVKRLGGQAAIARSEAGSALNSCPALKLSLPLRTAQEIGTAARPSYLLRLVHDGEGIG
jgi:hypothetical protein